MELAFANKRGISVLLSCGLFLRTYLPKPLLLELLLTDLPLFSFLGLPKPSMPTRARLLLDEET